MDDDDEYEMEADVSDDETTLLEEENIQGAVDYKSEIAELEVCTFFISVFYVMITNLVRYCPNRRTFFDNLSVIDWSFWSYLCL